MTEWDLLLPPVVASVQVSLMQGETYCTEVPTILITILGSCVAVCLWDRKRHVGGMNHFVLPSDPRGERSSRYGDVAIDELFSGMQRLGCKTSDLQAKVFGGAAVLPVGAGQSVGLSNVLLAQERLRLERIPVTAQRTGGKTGQQIRFHTKTGEVFFRYLAASTYGDGL